MIPAPSVHILNRIEQWYRRVRHTIRSYPVAIVTLLTLLVATASCFLIHVFHTHHSGPHRSPSIPASPATLPDGIVLHSTDSPAQFGRERVDERSLDAMHHKDHPTWGIVYKGKTYYI